MSNWHTEDCDNRNCTGGCHEGEVECLDCGAVWEGEWDECPDNCPECGEPFPDSSDPDVREDFHSDG